MGYVHRFIWSEVVYVFALFPDLFELDLNIFFVFPTTEKKIYKCMHA